MSDCGDHYIAGYKAATKAERERIERQIHEDIAPETLVFRDEDPMKDPRPAVYVPLAAVLAIIRDAAERIGRA